MLINLMKFPSPSGALMFLTGERKKDLVLTRKVSVPFRGFDVSNLGRRKSMINRTFTFPSPSGALMFLTNRGDQVMTIIAGFRPLPGL